MISTPDRMLNNTQSAFVGRKLIRVALNGIHFYPLICPLGALIVPKMGISWSRCHKGCPYNRFAGAYFHSNRPCRLPPTPPIMKMGSVGVRESGSHWRREPE